MTFNEYGYKFWNDISGYYIENKSLTDSIDYILTKIENGKELVIANSQIDIAETIKLFFPKESIYRLSVIDTNGIMKEYDIRYFPVLKDQIVSTLQSYLLTTKSSQCSNSINSPIADDLYLTELVSASIQPYLNLLIPSQFINQIQCCVANLFMYADYTLLYNLSLRYTTLSNIGTYKSFSESLKIILSIEYIIMYISTLQVASYTYDYLDQEISPDTELIASIINTFESQIIKDNFVERNLNFDILYDKFTACYLSKDTLNCLVSISPTVECASISDLTYSGYQHIIEVNTVVSPLLITWNATGGPSDLKLNDTDDKLINVEVVGNQYNTEGNLSYIHGTYTSMIMSLSGSNVETINNTTTWVYPSFTGKIVSPFGQPGIPDSDTIKDGNKSIDVTNLQFITNVDTDLDANQYGWFAVPKNQTGGHYTKWYQSENNNGNIDISGACASCNVEFKGEVTVEFGVPEAGPTGDVVYDVYMYKNATTVHTNVKYYK